MSISQTGLGLGLLATSSSTAGTGVHGYASAGSGTTYGVVGTSDSTGGIGVRGQGGSVGVEAASPSTSGVGLSATGGNVGVRSVTTDSTSAGVAGVFQTQNNNDAKLLSGLNSSATEVFSVTGTGNLTVSGSINTGTGAVSGAGGSYSGTTADQIVSVLQSGIGSGLTATTLSPDAASAAIRGYATNSQYLPTQSAPTACMALRRPTSEPESAAYPRVQRGSSSGRIDLERQ